MSEMSEDEISSSEEISDAKSEEIPECNQSELHHSEENAENSTGKDHMDKRNNHPNIQNKTNKTSIVRNHFDSVSKTEAKCKICARILKTKCSNTSVLLRHLKIHPQIKKVQNKNHKKTDESTELTQNNIIKAFSRQKELQRNSPRYKKITQAIAIMITADLQPFNMVADVGFKNLMRVVEPRYHIPSRDTFSRTLIPEMYKKEKDRIYRIIQEDLTEGVSAIGITTDGWTSRSIESYMSFTIHYSTKNFERRNFLLNLKHTPENHTSKNLHDFIENSLSEWGLIDQERLIFITTDNAANIVGAINMNKQWQRIPCFAHTLQLAIEDSVDETQSFNTIRKKCKSLVGFFSRSSTAKVKLHDMQKSINPNSPSLKLIQSVDTRWNSEYDMFSRLLELRPALSATLAGSNMPNNFSNSEWESMQLYADVLGPFKEATVFMSAEEYPTLSSYIPLVKGLINSTKEFITENTDKKRTAFGKHLLNALEDRFDDLLQQDHLILAMLTDPRYKNRLLNDEEQLQAAALMETKIMTLQETQDNGFLDKENADNTQKIGSGKSSTSRLFKFLSNIDNVDEQRSPSSNLLLEEINEYMNDRVAPSTINPSAWWKENNKRYPKIAQLSLLYLMLPATQVKSERIFSTAGNIVTSTRTKLLTSHVEELCFLHANLRI